MFYDIEETWEEEREKEREGETQIKETGEGKGDSFKHFFNITDSQYQIGFLHIRIEKEKKEKHDKKPF